MQAGDNWFLLDRDKEWDNILKSCEKNQDYEKLGALQDLNDKTFDILEGLYPAANHYCMLLPHMRIWTWSLTLPVSMGKSRM